MFGFGLFASDQQLFSDRQFLWRDIVKRLQDASVIPGTNNTNPRLNSGKYTSFTNKSRWSDRVPQEWRDIYGAIFEESKNFDIPEGEISKIKKDVHRTFGLFSRKLPYIRYRLEKYQDEYYRSLTSILTAASHERNYCQGINFLAASFLLSEGNDKDAFVVLCYILKQRHLEVLFNPKCSSLVEYMKLFEKRLRKHNKVVYRYCKDIGYMTVCYAVEWFTTCFIVSNPDVLSCCVIDLIISGFTDIMIRIGIAIMDCLEPTIIRIALDELQENFKTLVGALDPACVILRALSIPWDEYDNALEV